MIDTVVPGLSLLVQLAAVGFALGLARTSPGRIGWILIASGLALMAVRRGITFFRVVSGDATLPPDLTAELVALTISVVMLLGVLAIIPIVSRFQREREALAESDARLGGVLGNMVDGIVTITEDGCIESFNRAAEEIFGYASHEAIGKNVKMLMFESESARHDGFLKNYLDTGVGKILGIGPREVEGRRKDGAVVPLDLAISEMTVGSTRLFIGAVRDIGARRQAEDALAESEARYRRLIETSPDAMLVTGENRMIAFVNSAAIELFGAESADQLIGRNMLELVHPDHRESVEARRVEVLAGELPLIAERRRLRLDGSEFLTESRGAPITWDGDPAVLIAIRDITERRQAEEQLQQARKMEAVGQLTGGIAHDFNNLLTAIMGSLDLLRRRVMDVEAEQLVDIAARAGRRGANLTQRLLAFSRRQPLNPKPTDVNRTVPDIIEFLHHTLGEHIEIKTVLTGELWHAMIDATQFENALLNLAINARDAMPDGGKLTIETANAHLDRSYAESNLEVEAGQYVVVAVSDTGTGMAPETVAKAFDPFFTTKAEGRGSGLGLSMVYGFIKQSGGHVAIYSEVGHGTTVNLYLPRTGEEASEAVAAGDYPQALPEGSENVFVVEDDPDVRAYVESALGMLGYKVDLAIDGPQTLQRLDGLSRIDLLLTDVVLPGGMNGAQVAVAVRERFPETKVLFTSGYAENAIFHHGRLDEGVELLSKPYTVDTLARKVRLILDGA
jgi:PAS domain S-box-containing protein